jgi:hypothetical protein
MASAEGLALLDLNNPAFQETFFELEKAERIAAVDTLRKIRQMTWEQIYRDKGLHWEKIVSAKPPKGADAIYSIRITKARRAVAFRDGHYMRLLLVTPDHDSTYGKK